MNCVDVSKDADTDAVDPNQNVATKACCGEEKLECRISQEKLMVCVIMQPRYVDFGNETYVREPDAELLALLSPMAACCRKRNFALFDFYATKEQLEKNTKDACK